MCIHAWGACSVELVPRAGHLVALDVDARKGKGRRPIRQGAEQGGEPAEARCELGVPLVAPVKVDDELLGRRRPQRLEQRRGHGLKDGAIIDGWWPLAVNLIPIATLLR